MILYFVLYILSINLLDVQSVSENSQCECNRRKPILVKYTARAGRIYNIDAEKHASVKNALFTENTPGFVATINETEGCSPENLRPLYSCLLDHGPCDGHRRIILGNDELCNKQEFLGYCVPPDSKKTCNTQLLLKAFTYPCKQCDQILSTHGGRSCGRKDIIKPLTEKVICRIWENRGCSKTSKDVCNKVIKPCTQWSSWTKCTKGCLSHRTRSRSNTCEGAHEMIERCPISASSECVEFCNWGSWGRCTKNCGGVQTRRRPQSCGFPMSQQKDCNRAKDPNECENTSTEKPINPPDVTIIPNKGKLCEWSNWLDCSNKCGGVTTRRRLQNCGNPTSQQQFCNGADEIEECNTSSTTSVGDITTSEPTTASTTIKLTKPPILRVSTCVNKLENVNCISVKDKECKKADSPDELIQRCLEMPSTNIMRAECNDGLLSCCPCVKRLASSNGDPHTTTIDGHTHHYMGSCPVTLLQTCDEDQQVAHKYTLPKGFKVVTQAKTSNPKISHISTHSRISVVTDNATLEISYKNYLPVVKLIIDGDVKGSIVESDIGADELKFQLSKAKTSHYIGVSRTSKNKIRVTSDFGLGFETHGATWREWGMNIMNIYAPGVVSSCGIAGKMGIMKDGKKTSSVYKFGNSWIEETDKKNCDYVETGTKPKQVCQRMQKLRGTRFKENLFNKASKICEFITSSLYFEACGKADPKRAKWYERTCMTDVCVEMGQALGALDQMDAFTEYCRGEQKIALKGGWGQQWRLSMFGLAGNLEDRKSPLTFRYWIDLFWTVVTFFTLFFRTLVSPNSTSKGDTHESDRRDRFRGDGPGGGGGGGGPRRRIGGLNRGGGACDIPMGGGG